MKLFPFLLLLFIACKTQKDISAIKTETAVKNETNTAIEIKETNPIVLDHHPIIPYSKKPKNIILMIGDGMGLGQISAGMYAQGNQTVFERFPVIGLHKPHASNMLVTDSAAAATAFACGVKTYNGAIGMDRDSIPVQSFLELAEFQGWATGLVATSEIQHATPASFIAHNVYRRNYEEISEDFLETEIDYMVGGGKKYFDRREKDDRDILAEMEAKGYDVYNYITDFENCSMDTSKNFVYITADDKPIPAAFGRDYLIPASIRGIEYLKEKNENGFFMMIEGSQIDWGGHANDENYVISEYKDFDKTVNEVLNWVLNDGETLLIVTADHETGGFAIHHKSTMDELIINFTSTKHTGTMIPVFATGPGSEHFGGIYENTDIYHRMRQSVGWLKR